MTVASGMTEAEACESNGYLTTTGRVTGKAHEIEIWFAVEPESAGQTLYLLAGGRERSDWVRNVRHDAAVRFQAGGTTYRGLARIVEPEEPVDGRARVVVAGKYGEQSGHGDLSAWARDSLPVVIDLVGREGESL